MKKKMTVVIAFLGLFVIFILSNVSNKEDTITVSGGVTSESQILGNIVVELLQHYTDKNIVFLNNLASANLMQAAMERGDLDIASPRYTGTDLVGTLNLPIEKNPDKALKIVQKEFRERYQFEWFPSYGFSNQFTFMVTKETAKKYNLTKVSDLKEYATELNLGTDQTWYKREGDGYHAFTEEYGMTFKRVFPMQVGLLYDALVADKLNVILGYSTDGRVGSYDLVMLEDDLKFFPPYTSSLVASEKVLKENPELKTILTKLEGTIDTETMQKMNNQSDSELLEPALIARKFLESHNYFEEETP
ncbi:osmoprotectant ABC transporter substrate-binding protein [Enterococcus rivorum]|uniref:Glycine/betaine ABC transporter substrate-binding protein n=1 Tax=Enterococcus rivorum TaxID=762845 RepID=A0A1E5KUJ0_9ENTE|nr:osmoprotectant ABC transporter substrate-binding protein [Enterococcus rivorum]MBP2099796.1 osmoprotectant transport system substrate-binding protein [Enterococcus rivorum]OEH81546.1 glycine/betaine ABC transporter substrate-binding protein [Enterococcus rivorum]